MSIARFCTAFMPWNGVSQIASIGMPWISAQRA